MRLPRLWLLILLAVLLPLRGAVAAAMLCQPVPAAPMAAAPGHAAGHHHAAPDTDHAQPQHDKCHVCAAFCSLTPMPAAEPGLPQPAAAAAAAYPELPAPAATFLCDGPERPPRPA